MFRKPVKVSGNVQLKNKDIKNLRRSVAERFRNTCESADDVNLKLLFKSSSIKKLSFHAPSPVVVYVAETDEPFLFDATGKGEYCFTVYALWHAPALLPPLTVHAPVSEFVLRGADVMLPGVVFSSTEEFQSLHKGEIRAVYAQGNPCAIGVGEILMDATDVERCGKHGKVLKLWHVFGDALWKMGPQTLPNEGFLENKVVPLECKQEEEMNGVSLESITLEETKHEVTKEQMDSYYVAALLQALKSSKIREKDLPMLASLFHAQVLLPCRRVGVSLSIKHSSFKKLSIFLKAMETHGLLVVEDNDGVLSITDIAKRHPDVVSHVTYQTAEEAQAEEQTALNKTGVKSAFVPGEYAPEVEESVCLSPQLKSLLTAGSKHPLPKYWSNIEIRDLVAEYIDTQGLVDPENKRFIRLNGPLSDALYGKKVPASGYPERLPRPEILQLLLSKCTHYHRIKLFPTHAANFHHGNFQPISIHAKKLKHRNNKTVTCIAFYQQFGIDGNKFAKEVQKKWGCSASVQIPDDKTSEEIQIHGQMANEVLEYLRVKYLIIPKFCTVTYSKNVKAKKK